MRSAQFEPTDDEVMARVRSDFDGLGGNIEAFVRINPYILEEVRQRIAAEKEQRHLDDLGHRETPRA